MTGKVLDSSSSGILILILPVAFAVVVLYSLWPLLLVLAILSIAWRMWEKYQWQQLCKQVNPYFNKLLKENQGCLTATDLSLKANLTGRAAKKFLDRRTEDYGGQRKEIDNKGVVYYFLTASALGSIFDDSEPVLELESAKAQLNPALSPQFTSVSSQFAQNLPESSTGEVSQLVEAEVSKANVSPTLTKIDNSSSGAEVLSKSANITHQEGHSGNNTNLILIQSDLAKRLDITPSAVGRKKSSADFAEWSQSKDPEGVAWKYIQETNMFVPVDAS